jgi:hypothetical protein
LIDWFSKPCELRDMIYRLLLIEDRPLHNNLYESRGQYSSDPGVPWDENKAGPITYFRRKKQIPTILLVNKQMAPESCQILYGENSFLTRDEDRKCLHSHGRAWVQYMSPCSRFMSSSCYDHMYEKFFATRDMSSQAKKTALALPVYTAVWLRNASSIMGLEIKLPHSLTHEHAQSPGHASKRFFQTLRCGLRNLQYLKLWSSFDKPYPIFEEATSALMLGVNIRTSVLLKLTAYITNFHPRLRKAFKKKESGFHYESEIHGYWGYSPVRAIWTIIIVLDGRRTHLTDECVIGFNPCR